MRVLRVSLAASALLVLAACGGGNGGGGEIPSAGGGAAASASASADADRSEQLLAFAQCMRDNGIDLPDPDEDGMFRDALARIDRTSPAFQKAFTACQSRLPNGGEAPKLDATQLEQYIQWAACMRDNGIEIPDPNPDGTLPLGELVGSGAIDLQDPGFQRAMTACQDKRPQLRLSGGPS